MLSSRPLRYGVAVIAPIVALLLKLTLQPLFQEGTPFLLFFSAVLVSAWLGGLRAGLVATAITTLFSYYFFLAPPSSVLRPLPGDNLRLLLFLAECILVSLIFHAMFSARQRERASQQTLRQSEEMFRLLVENVAEYAIFILDLNGNIASWNVGAERLFGWPASEIVGQPWARLFNEEEVQSGLPEREMRVAETQGHSRFGGWRVRRDGTPFLVDEVITALRDEAGHLRGYSKIVRDVTERMLSEAALRESEERFRTMADSAPILIWMAGTDGGCYFFNKPWLEFRGRTLAEEQGDGWAEGVHPDDYENCLRIYRAAFAARESFQMEYRLQRADGEYRWLLDRGVPLRSPDGEFVGYIGSCTDISAYRLASSALQHAKTELENRVAERTGELAAANLRLGQELVERQRAETALQEANLKLESSLDKLAKRTTEISLLSQMSDLLQVCQASHEAYEVVARFAAQLFPEASGRLYIYTASKSHVETVAQWGDFPSGDGTFPPEACWGLRLGHIHLVDAHNDNPQCTHLQDTPIVAALCIPLLSHTETLGVLCLQVAAQGANPQAELTISEAQQRLASTLTDQIALALSNLKLREMLQRQVVRDPLTGLFNRRYMEESLERELKQATRNGKPLAVFMLDIDYFKNFNDTFGHAAGDALLVELGELFRHQVRGGDIACRYGGEEFTLILPDTPADIACQRAEQLRRAVKAMEVYYQDQRLRAVTISIGVATFPEHGATVDALLHRADEALYRAKREGRDRVVLNGVG
jgi:diguanylate cyclase (GGDEF)-like protein/PAS domain S-box-containing protein